jgi:hypothetical protein
LNPVAGTADQSPAGDHFVPGRVLADDQQSRAAIHPPSVAHGSPLRAEVLGREDGRIWNVLHEGAERLLTVAGIERDRHRPSWWLGESESRFSGAGDGGRSYPIASIDRARDAGIRP